MQQHQFRAAGPICSLADYFDVQYLEGRSSHEGEKTLAALEFQFHECKGRLGRSRKASKGWRKLVPTRGRLPLPTVAAYGIAMQMMVKNERAMALMVLLSVDLYLKPGEAISLTGKNVVAPVKGAGVQYQHYTVVIRDEGELHPDKTVFNNSMPLDNPHTRNWLGKQIHSLKEISGDNGNRPIQVGGLQETLSEKRKMARIARSSCLPTTTWRRLRRLVFKAEGPQRSEGEGRCRQTLR